MHDEVACTFAGSADCSKELKEWNKVNFQLSGMTLAGQINVSHISDEDLKTLEGIGLDVTALQKKPCSMQIVLLPFGEKDEPVLYKGTHHLKGGWGRHHVLPDILSAILFVPCKGLKCSVVCCNSFPDYEMQVSLAVPYAPYSRSVAHPRPPFSHMGRQQRKSQQSYNTWVVCIGRH